LGAAEAFDSAAKKGEEVREEGDESLNAGLEGRRKCLGFEDSALLVQGEKERKGGKEGRKRAYEGKWKQ